MRLVSATVVLLAPLLTWAEACKNIDFLDREPLKSKHSIYQREANWCAGFALSDALSMHIGKPISGVDIIIAKKKNKQENSSDGVLVEHNSLEDMLDGVNQFGVCEEKAYKTPDFGTYIPTILSLERVYNNDPNFCEERVVDNILNQSFYSNISDLADVIREAKLEKSFSDFLYHLSDKNCKQHRITGNTFSLNHFDVPLLSKFGLSSSQTHLATIDDALINETVPLIGVDPSAFGKTRENGLMSLRRSNLRNKLNGNHVVSVVGMKKIENQCYYKVRDSNLECHNIAKEILECDSKTATMLVPKSIIADAAKHIFTISQQ